MNFLSAWFFMMVALVGVSLLHLTFGASWVFSGADSWSPQEQLIFWEIRLPRLFTALSVGAGLGVAGVALQALFRNPLAEPGLIGVSAGSAFGAVFVMVLGSLLWHEITWWQIGAAAFVSGLLTIGVLYAIATRNGRTDVALMLLAGVAFNALFGASTQFLMTLSDALQLQTVTFWLMGSLANLSWQSVMLLMFVSLVALMGLLTQLKPMNAFVLGEETCLHMGYDPRSFKWRVMIFSALIVAGSVAAVGVIGFVGLVVPHIVRLWIGADHRAVLPVSALGGAFLLVTADLFARQLLAPVELPIGLLMAMLGGPFFLWLLLQSRRSV
ncbi:iron ABC transporter permease [Thiomicrorhabdus sp.]|uniref:FecCD family ABC transporter permease n=1 Tax=Thiomicrorhabdus sp. TaxID=2039724 RepID=UPI0029C7D498|nr:iron ABC transporter permease [Thiomicrorhabdus sp.]